MDGILSKTAAVVLLSYALVCFAGQPARAAELKKETAAAFERYVDASNARINTEVHSESFLFIDGLQEKSRMQAYAKVRQGDVQLKQEETQEEGHPFAIPHGLIYDWIGVLFIPNASLKQALAVVQDYDNYQNIYKPAIRHSRLLSRNGDSFKISLQLYRRSPVTVVIDAGFDIVYDRLGADRTVSRSYSTRLAEVENAGQSDEREMPSDAAHGYLWRLVDYWRFEEKDGGVYVQLESIGLSRSVPDILGWLINPLLRSIPRGILSSLLGATRTEVVHRVARANSRGQKEYSMLDAKLIQGLQVTANISDR
jgi:hypothetical protein